MTYLAKPKFHHPELPKNALGYTHRDYEGTVSTLCAGCGHDSITAAIIQACFELSIEPHRVYRRALCLELAFFQAPMFAPRETITTALRTSPRD